MAIVFHCTNCNHALRVPDDVAGKRIKCPQCQEVLRIPESSETVPADSTHPQPQSMQDQLEPLLQLKTPDGSVYGPVTRVELDRWLDEGRITAECELLDEQGNHWRWASEVYPELKAVATPPPPPSPSGLGQATPVTVQPVAPGYTAPATAPASVSPWQSFQGDQPSAYAARSTTDPILPSFRPRSYPAMNLTSRFYRALGWIMVFLGGIAACGVLFVLLAMSTDKVGLVSDGFLLMAIPALVLGAINLVALVITLWFVAEAIKCLLDIEDNTHRSSFYLENQMRQQRTE